MPLNVAVLMIGALYWDESPNRVNWRNRRLRMDDEYTVQVPTRYGRLSVSRGNTYTMVFSRLCLRKSHGLGTGKVIPFDRPIDTAEQLIREARLLWAAELNRSNSNNLLSAGWGCVALLLNPNGQVPVDFLNRWRTRIAEEPEYGRLMHTKREGPVITEDGFLNIPWPQLHQKAAPLPMDLLLVTANSPTLRGDPPIYPRMRKIARAWQRDNGGHERYFWLNRENGIQTYQDDTLLRLLR